MAKPKLLECSKEEKLESYFQKAKLLQESGDIQGALECFDQAMEACPSFPEILMEKADLYFEIGEEEKALECYDIIYNQIDEKEE